MVATSAPATIALNGAEAEMWTWEQLSQLSRRNVMHRAMNLRDLVGEARLPPLDIADPARWLIDAQVACARACGHAELTPRSFGAPEAVSGPGATLTEKEKLRLHHHGLSDSAIDRMDRDFASASKSIARASPPPLGPEDATRESKSEVMAEWMHHHSMSHLGLAKDGIADECAAVAVHNKERPNPSRHRRA